MSGELKDTPDLGLRYCPGCETARDPSREILVTAWCPQHGTDFAGPDDAAITVAGMGLGSMEADSANCRAAADFLHRHRVGEVETR